MFTYPAFRALIEEVKDAGYCFRRFDDPAPADEKVLYLRHDVDISPYGARQMAIIEHDCGIVGNFFFQLNADTYCMLSTEILEIVKHVASFGHCVGLHIDEKLLADDEHRIVKTIHWFHECISPISNVISFHRPSPVVIGRTFAQFVNTYDTPFFHPDRYCSDSRRNHEFYPKLQNLLQNGEKPLQLLLHPGWWTDEPDMAVLFEKLLARRTRQAAMYLRDNAAKVFGPFVPGSDPNFDV